MTFALVALMLAPGWAAAWMDVHTRRIPNWPIALGLALAYLVAAHEGELAEAVMGSVVCGLLGLALVVAAQGEFGRGDAKLMAYGGAATGATAVPLFLLWMALCGGVIVLVAVSRRRRAAIPYALAIAGGCSLAYVLGS
ncbi:MAG: prepilin peptidase [Dehalococcoidia bacterium]|nr:prepilin peptidase [Dehalococcoidia bacterium]